MNKQAGICFGGNVLQYLLTSIQTNEIFQIVEMVLAIITSIILLIYRIWHWVKETKEDGKITQEEIEEGLDILSSGVEDIKDSIKKGDKKND